MRPSFLAISIPFLLLLTWGPFSQVEASWQKHGQEGLEAFRKGNFDQAQEQLEAAITEATRLGIQSLKLAPLLRRLGEIFERQERYDKASLFFQQALALTEALLGRNHS